MLSLPPGTRIWLATEPCDMRKGFHSLVALVRQRLPELDPLSGQLFVFIGRNRRAVKILWWSSGGLSLYLKRLEQGTFRLPAPRPAAASLALTATDLAMLLDGIDWSTAKRQKLYEPARSPTSR